MAPRHDWRSLFDGKTLNGWEKIRLDTSNEDKSSWEVKDGAMTGAGLPSMLVSTKTRTAVLKLSGGYA